MRRIIITLGFLLAALGAAASFGGELVDRHDRFAGKRELKWLSHVRSSDPASLGLTVSIYFERADKPVNALVHLAGSFDTLEYLSCHTMDWLADGVPVKSSANSYQVQPLNDSPQSIEIVTSIFTVAQLQQLAAAQTVEYRICRDEGRVPAEDHAGLRQLVDRIDQ